MKQTLWNGLLAAAVLISTASCSDDKYSAPDTGTGSVNLSLDIDGAVISATSARAGLDDIAESLTADDFTIRLTDANGDSQQWNYADFNGSHVKIGSYTLEAFYGSATDEGFEKPYFAGSTELTVTTDNTTNAAVTATLANAAIIVNYTDAFTKYMSDYEASVRTAGSTDGITYPASATDELFVTPGDASLYVRFTTPQGKTATLKAAEFTTEPQHRYTVTIDVNGGEIGDAVLSITFDDSTLQADKEITLSDELLNMPAPTVTPASASVDIIEGNRADAKMNIVARAGISSVKLTTSCASLIAKGWPAEIDLMRADAAMQATLTQLGLDVRGLWKNPDMMAVIDFSGAIASIRTSGDTPETSTFRVEVEDEYGKVSDPAAMLTVNVTPIKFEITGHSMVMVDQSDVTLNVTYNGGDLNRDVKFMQHTSRDTWEDAPIVSAVNKAPSRATSDSWTVTLRVEPTQTDVVLRATALNLPPISYTIERSVPDFAISASDNDAFATYATVSVTSDNDDMAASVAASAKWQASVDGGSTYTDVTNISVNGNRVTLGGLTPGKKQTIRATLSSKSETTTLNTEAATQLPYSDMATENWTRTDGASSNWWIEFLGDKDNTVWATLNQLTTSEGGNSGGINRNKYAYNAFSGTRGITDENRSVAVIQTVGWGKGSSATGAAACKHVNEGQLYLGTYNDAPVYGTPFTSRPSGLSFTYKYVAKNSADYGWAEISVLDANGNVMATANKQLTATSGYTSCNMPLSYKSMAKAATLQVIFKSSGNPECIKIDKNYLSVPGFGKTDGTGDDKRYIGSSLYIDDITLNY